MIEPWVVINESAFVREFLLYGFGNIEFNEDSLNVDINKTPYCKLIRGGLGYG